MKFTDPKSALAGAQVCFFCGPKERLLAADVRALLPAGADGVWEAMIERLEPGDAGASTETYLGGDSPVRLVAGALPEVCSRHNSPAQPHAVAKLAKAALGGKGKVAVILALDTAEHAFAAGSAIARALPLYSRKQEGGEAKPEREVSVACAAPDGDDFGLELISASAEGVRLAASLVDRPTAELHTDAYLDDLRALAGEAGVQLTVLRGEELEAQGYGGLWNVGKTAVHPPALAILSHNPAGASETVCWVGKGIVYDTGGLSLKGKDGMPGMKADMGGAAAVTGAFFAAVKAGHSQNLHALLCLAENAIGPQAVRPDDIIKLYSGKTVEINNTDAEGRLVLGDGVAHAAKHIEPDVIVDLATLTGAQLVATGRRHASIVANGDEIEARAMQAGKRSGDLVHPLPYCPEFYRKEFESKVADMKNSVKDRANAQSSCAAQFIAEHLGDFTGQWLHVDLAGPAVAEERGTGFGVALLLEMFVR
ncbi:MAG: M17 family metallopeptidase [Planctomycetota bacterium]|jgi:probable aminopeptidase NPEPL1